MSAIRIFLLILVLGCHLVVSSQSLKSPVSRVINASGTSQIAPSLSGDGRHMIYTSTSNFKRELLVFYSYQQRPGKWTQPEQLTVINRSLQINHIGGYSLSYDGNYIFFTSRKSYGIGKFDIWYSKRTANNQWSAPVNLAKPVNSSKDDGCPSLSTDGKTIYFVRCETMDIKEGTGCQLMMAKRKNQDYWEAPKALPDYINDGNIMSPRILADDQTLIYAKGQGDAWDLYQTRLVSGEWTKPIALDFVNTAKDERFASVPARGDILYYSTEFKGTYDIIKAKIPEELQPLKVLYLKGEISNQQGIPLEAFIQIYDVEDKSLVKYHRTKQDYSGFEFYLTAGRQYDFSVVSLAPNYSFYSEIIDLSELTTSSRRKMDITLENLDHGISFPLNCLQFENDSTLSNISRFEMSRLIKLLKKNPGTQLEIAVHRETWAPDSMNLSDSTIVQFDSLFNEEPLVSESSLQAVDSLQLPLELLQQPPPEPTQIQAQAVARYLQERGVPEYLLEAKGYADTEPLSTGDTEEEQLLNRRVEIRIL